MVYYPAYYDRLYGVGVGGARARAGLTNAVETQPCSGAEEELKKIKAAMLTLLENKFSCQICKYPCDMPMAADCGHKFCEGCLNEKKKPLRRRGKLQCPSCRSNGSKRDLKFSYNDDLMISFLLHNISPEMGRYFNSVKLRKQEDARCEAQTGLRNDRNELQNIKANFAFFCALLIILGFILLFGKVIARGRDEWSTDIKHMARYAEFAIRNFVKELTSKEPTSMA